MYVHIKSQNLKIKSFKEDQSTWNMHPIVIEPRTRFHNYLTSLRLSLTGRFAFKWKREAASEHRRNTLSNTTSLHSIRSRRKLRAFLRELTAKASRDTFVVDSLGSLVVVANKLTEMRRNSGLEIPKDVKKKLRLSYGQKVTGSDRNKELRVLKWDAHFQPSRAVSWI